MLVRSYSKNNNLVAEEVISTLKEQYPSRQWVASSKLSSDEIRGLNNQFGIENTLSLSANSDRPIEQPQAEETPQELHNDELTGQIQQTSQQLPQAQQSQSEMAQSIQYLLTQQQIPSYSSELSIEAAALDGSNDAYREFMAFQSSKASTRQGLQQLAQTLNELKYKASADGFEQTQKDFLLHLQANSEKLQATTELHQQQVQTTKKQTDSNINLMQNAVLNAIKEIRTGSSQD